MLPVRPASKQKRAVQILTTDTFLASAKGLPCGENYSAPRFIQGIVNAVISLLTATTWDVGIFASTCPASRQR